MVFVDTLAMEIDAEKLIVAVESRPALYNYQLKEYHVKDLIEKLWDEVGREVGATGKWRLCSFITRDRKFIPKQ